MLDTDLLEMNGQEVDEKTAIKFGLLKDYCIHDVKETDRQINIRTELENKVEQAIFTLYKDLVTLNLIHHDFILGDRRLKKNIKLEKQLERYMRRK